MNQIESFEPEIKPSPRAAPSESPSALEDPGVIRAVQEYLAALEAGGKPDRREFLGNYPEIAVGLAECLDALEFVHTATPHLDQPALGQAAAAAGSAAVVHPEAPLGDYRIIREIGRGGMGVVYEAVQISLGRRVALKVLPFASTLDARQLQRFKNEAQAAAHLHHQSIVPVYATGCERGVHYYAMQFIEGQTVATLIRELRNLAGFEPQDTREGEAPAEPSRLASDLATGRWAPVPEESRELVRSCGGEHPTGSYQSTTLALHHLTTSPPDTPHVAVLSTERSTKSLAYFRTVANLGVQAAEALEHAHQLGVVHRDIKPANLMVDVRVNVWITDFGLAHCQHNAGLTMTGDLVGTLRYMSPEQALAQRVQVDHRTDVYSLGVTLYELLTLEPAYHGQDRQELLRQIAFEEPRPPRRVNQAVPPEMETIVLKAMEKNPTDRYATAQEVADDLRRFLDDKPIRAKRPTLLQRLRKWARRHKPVVWTAGISAVILLVMVAVVALLTAYWTGHQLQLTKRAEDKATQRLYHSLYAQAQASRFSRRVGQRFDSLEALAGAAQLLPSLELGAEQVEEEVLKLRNEAIASMALADIRVIQRWDGDFRWGVAWDAPLERYAVADGKEGDISLRRVADNRELSRLPGSDTRWGPLLFSPDGQYLAAQSTTLPATIGQCRVWDLSRRVVVLDVRVDPRGISPDFSADSRLIAIPESDGFIHFYDLPSGKAANRLATDAPPVAVRFHPTAIHKLAVFSHDSKKVQVWDRNTGNVLQKFPHPGRLYGAAWNRDGTLLGISWSEHAESLYRVDIWDVKQDKRQVTLEGHLAEAGPIGFDDSDLVATRSWDGTTRVWNARGGQELVRVAGEGTRFSSDGRRLSFSNRTDIGIWEVAVSRECRILYGHQGGKGPWCVDISPDGRLMASAGNDGVRLWDLATHQELTLLVDGISHSALFHPLDGSLLTTGKNGLQLWPIIAESQGKRMRIGPPELLSTSAAPPFLFHACSSADGRFVAAVSGPDEIVVIDRASQTKKVLHYGRPEVEFLAISPDGHWLAAETRGGGTIKVWDIQRGAVVQDLLPDTSHNPEAFSPDGKWLVTNAAGEYRFWEVGSWKPGRRIPKDRAGSLRGLSFTRDGKMLAIAYSPYLVQLIDTANGRPLATLEAPEQRHLMSLCFSPDGSRLAAASENHVIYLWDLRLIREQLAGMGLDWDLPSYRPVDPSQQDAPRLEVEVLSETKHETPSGKEVLPAKK